MQKKNSVIAVAFVVVISVQPASAQQAKNVFRIGTLFGGAPNTSEFLNWFREGMRDLGYAEGRNYVLVSRWARGKRKQVPTLAKELVRQKVDVIFTRGSLQTRALANATKTIPIVVGSSGILTRFVKSLAKPGGNITGLTFNARAIYTKRLGLIKEALPNIKRVAFLYFSPGNLPKRLQRDLKQLKAAGEQLGVEIEPFHAPSLADVENVLAAMTNESTQAVIINNEQFSHFHQSPLAAQTAAKKLPSVCDHESFARAGCLMSYTPDRRYMARRAAEYVVKIIKGASPGELPVEISSKYKLVINLKTAKTIGIALSGSILLHADEVIE